MNVGVIVKNQITGFFCEKFYMWNPSTCDCEYNKDMDI